jgi:hypothetical protein
MSRASGGGNRDREAFAALLLGAIGGGARLRGYLADLLDSAPPLPGRRPLEPGDYALLGLIGFPASLEAAIKQLLPDQTDAAEQTAAEPRQQPLLHGILR